jgi:hypothetical protein
MCFYAYGHTLTVASNYILVKTKAYGMSRPT